MNEAAFVPGFVVFKLALVLRPGSDIHSFCCQETLNIKVSWFWQGDATPKIGKEKENVTGKERVSALHFSRCT